jgi:hypothetical protein
MPPLPIKSSANAIDLSPRFVVTTAITGSPALAAETIIATLTLPQFGDPTVVSGIDLSGWATFTVGTSGTAVTLRIRQTGLAGTVIVTSGALTGGIAATNLVAQDIEGFDAAPGIGVYVMTLQVTAGAAASTVTAVKLRGILI